MPRKRFVEPTLIEVASLMTMTQAGDAISAGDADGVQVYDDPN